MSPLLELRGTEVHYRLRSGRPRVLGGTPLVLRAVDGVDLEVQRGVSFGIVGESGCGKTTLARAITGLVEPTAGQIIFDGAPLGGTRNRALRRRLQMVFQDPSSALNPRLKVGTMLAELLRVHGYEPSRIRARSRELLDLVGLAETILDVTPRRLSGGQRQRVGIARCLAVEPELLIADEAVSALDVSVQAAVLNLLIELQQRLGLTLVFISHDLAVVRNVCDRVAVMYLGRIVEEASTEELFTAPQHPYTRALLSAAPRTEVGLGTAPPLPGEPPSPLALPSGCRFNPRCKYAVDACRGPDEPPMLERDDHRAACLFAWDEMVAVPIPTGLPEKPG